MKLKFNSFLFVLALGFSTFVNAQEDHFNCGHDKRTQELWKQHPEMKADYQQLMNSARQFARSESKPKNSYIIPVVFHVIHEYGVENISDSQIYDQMAVLNRDYSKQNADVALAVAGFDTIAGDANIEFRLASIDPFGNCTNGIEHIYSHETGNGDDYSKHNQWMRSRYLNIWVVKTMRDGAAGYAYYPSGVEGTFFFADGIIILHPYIGRTGTGAEGRSRALTHEIGHWLGLSHTWGNNNDPGIECGDDQVEDTPITKGFTFCPTTLAQARVCNDTIVENYQNYMDYSYCSVMFTRDQVSFMQNSLLAETANRNNLWQEGNLDTTGVSVLPAPLCAPVADFAPANKFVCEGSAVVFKDASWNAAVTSRTWYFQDGTPSTSTDPSPSVTFSEGGWKKVTLVVRNAAGSDSLVMDKSVFVSRPWADFYGPYSEDFETATQYYWVVDNPEDNYAKWQISNNGYSNSKCMKLNNFRDISGAQPYTDLYFYNNRMGGTKDALISPSYNLTNTSGSELIFEYAYATNATEIAGIKEELVVYVSKDCGRTWTPRKTLTGAELLTAGSAGGMDFKPTSNTQWKTCTVPVSITALDTRTRFKFEFKASDVSNNVYIDNIRVTGVLGIEENPLNVMDLTVYPNPSTASEGITVDYIANENPVQFQLMDVQGKVLTTETDATTNGAVSHQLQLSSPLAAGCYYLKISQGEFSITKKVVML